MHELVIVLCLVISENKLKQVNYFYLFRYFKNHDITHNKPRR